MAAVSGTQGGAFSRGGTKQRHAHRRQARKRWNVFRTPPRGGHYTERGGKILPAHNLLYLRWDIWFYVVASACQVRSGPEAARGALLPREPCGACSAYEGDQQGGYVGLLVFVKPRQSLGIHAPFPGAERTHRSAPGSLAKAMLCKDHAINVVDDSSDSSLWGVREGRPAVHYTPLHRASGTGFAAIVVCGSASRRPGESMSQIR